MGRVYGARLMLFNELFSFVSNRMFDKSWRLCVAASFSPSDEEIESSLGLFVRVEGFALVIEVNCRQSSARGFLGQD
jgi:hypothetical protein